MGWGDQALSNLVKRGRKLSNVVRRRQMCSKGAKRGLRLLAMVE